MYQSIFNPSLLNTNLRIQSCNQSDQILLDKNEQADDISIALKIKVMENLMHSHWNRYPTNDLEAIESKTAAYCNVDAEHILMGNGSANLITILLNYFALQHKRIIITQPTYSLFDYHCKTYGIPYIPWHLTENLEFDYTNTPILDGHSVLIITSPNNPVGNCFDVGQLENLLLKNPESCIILENVYKEFSEIEYTHLIKKYSNLIVLRSFSKAFPAAGLRLGYMCAAPPIVQAMKKLMLPFSITAFTLSFANTILFDTEFMQECKMKVSQIIQQRNHLSAMISHTFESDKVTVYPSAGNFLLIKIHQDQTFESVVNNLTNSGIKVLNTSGSHPLMNNTFRVSIGTTIENDRFITCFFKSVEQSHKVVKRLELADIRA